MSKSRALLTWLAALGVSFGLVACNANPTPYPYGEDSANQGGPSQDRADAVSGGMAGAPGEFVSNGDGGGPPSPDPETPAPDAGSELGVDIGEPATADIEAPDAEGDGDLLYDDEGDSDDPDQAGDADHEVGPEPSGERQEPGGPSAEPPSTW